MGLFHTIDFHNTYTRIPVPHLFLERQYYILQGFDAFLSLDDSVFISYVPNPVLFVTLTTPSNM